MSNGCAGLAGDVARKRVLRSAPPGFGGLGCEILHLSHLAVVAVPTGHLDSRPAIPHFSFWRAGAWPAPRRQKGKVGDCGARVQVTSRNRNQRGTTAKMAKKKYLTPEAPETWGMHFARPVFERRPLPGLHIPWTSVRHLLDMCQTIARHLLDIR